MIFTAYIDESDTHGKEPDIVMSAFLGNPRQWEIFNRRLKGIQREFGFTIFHATDFKSERGEFRGWSGEKHMALISKLTELVRDELTEGIVTQLPFRLYDEEFVKKLPAKMHRISQYAVCFMSTLEHCLSILGKTKTKHRLSVVLEEGHNNAKNAEEIFEQRRQRYLRQFRVDVLRSMTIGKKKDFPELMAADFLAHTAAMGYRQKAIDQPHYPDLTATQPRKRESGLTFQEITPQYLQAIISEFEADKKASNEAYLRRKEEHMKGAGRFNVPPNGWRWR